MPRMRYSTHSITLDVPYERAFAYLSDWRTQPEWAINFVKGVRQVNDQILLTTPFGEVPVTWQANRELGTIDLRFADGNLIPTRLTEMRDGTLLYTLTFGLPAETPAAAFQAGQRGMEEELQTLKRLLEG